MLVKERKVYFYMTSTDKKYSHLTLEERNIIEDMLKNDYSLCLIARTIGRDKTTISKEIKKHREVIYPNRFNNQRNICIHSKECKELICDSSKKCFDNICPNLKHSPYVCNGCAKKHNCRLIKYYYNARKANNDYIDLRSESRQGVRLSKVDEKRIESIINPLIKEQNQSVNEIYINNPDLLPFTKPTFYSYVNQGLFHLCNLDLRRKVRYKPRKNGIKVTRKETKIRINRTYKDFLDYISQHPNYNIVEMDTVEGVKGGKVFLTLYFRKSHLMLIFLLDNKTTDEVNRVFNELKETLGLIPFKKLFRIILTDNGSEFYDPDSIENYNNIKIINLFYCDPRHSEQKAGIEKNHEYIRYVLPKGCTFDYLSQKDAILLFNNINNSPRGSLNNKSPYVVFKDLYRLDILNKLNCYYIKPNEVNLSKKLLADHKNRKKRMIKLINDLEYYYQFKRLSIDDNIKNQIIKYFIDDWYKYTDSDLFYQALNTFDNLISK